MSVLSIEVDNPEVMEILREMEKEGKIRITEELLTQPGDNTRGNISDLHGAINMSPERLQEWLDSVKEGREERFEKVPS